MHNYIAAHRICLRIKAVSGNHFRKPPRCLMNSYENASHFIRWNLEKIIILEGKLCGLTIILTSQRFDMMTYVELIDLEIY